MATALVKLGEVSPDANGKILTGKNGVAAELGHIPILGVDEICGCGNVDRVS